MLKTMFDEIEFDKIYVMCNMYLFEWEKKKNIILLGMSANIMSCYLCSIFFLKN